LAASKRRKISPTLAGSGGICLAPCGFVARPGIFLGGVFSVVPGAEAAPSKILAAGFLIAVFLLRIRAP
jgi:hypothetical protein